MNEERTDKELTSLLREWTVDAKPCPEFAAGVWRRIARGKAEALATPAGSRLRWWNALNKRMDLGWGTAAALLIALGAGWLGHRSGTPRDGGTPDGDSYLSSVDPYRMTP